ncbi:MAG: flagellar hook-basal body protein [Kurthia gibsonii]|uniref:Flagellar hook-basal body protein n=1 Tax=Kurthia gibsonii TaxID=33946 RepID=A0ABU9LID5_9BACL|nr:MULTISPECIES: flagellar hook-basal body protein [Kurthia]AMA61939.1 flagellar hook-basal body family protein [Kurthia sp. 11kri321]MEB7772013.1 flagellar hook-basal body protein [Kurthia gibsonii]RXH50964.1 flagellar hook-basal body protein [Kurthia gibsonii]WIL39035.1 flagellar hook-basal body protein [Kurthia sp. YJT4]HZG11640.1 flagellar hook-basal body protein [Kurthia gibsonii]
MLRTMLTATNTMSQLQQKLDTVSSNIANSNTVGYKARNATFGEMLYQQFNNDTGDRAPRQSPAGIRIGVGAQIAQTKLNTKVGNVTQTNRKLDFALTKENQYFTFLSPSSDRLVLSRQGNFYLSPNANGSTSLVNSDGYDVADSNGRSIRFDKDVSDITVTPDGTMNVTFADGSRENVELGIAQVSKPNLLKQDEDKYLRYSDDIAAQYPNEGDIANLIVGNDRAQISVEGGALESSNVDLSKEMSELINTQRSYQMNARTITMADQMLGLINGMR